MAKMSNTSKLIRAIARTFLWARERLLRQKTPKLGIAKIYICGKYVKPGRDKLWQRSHDVVREALF